MAQTSVIIVGAGPNLGAAVARRFGREGFAVGLIARDEVKLRQLTADLAGQGMAAAHAAADIRDPETLSAAIARLADDLGPVEVLEYSPLPAAEFMKPILETTAIGGRIGPGLAHEPDDVAETLWRQHTDRIEFQTLLGINESN